MIAFRLLKLGVGVTLELGAWSLLEVGDATQRGGMRLSGDNVRVCI